MSNNQNEANKPDNFNNFSKNADPKANNSNQQKTGDDNKQKQDDTKPKPADDSTKKI